MRGLVAYEAAMHIKSTKLSTCCVRSQGNKKPGIECHHMASIYGPIWGPLGPLGQNDQANVHTGPQAFHMDLPFLEDKDGLDRAVSKRTRKIGCWSNLLLRLRSATVYVWTHVMICVGANSPPASACVCSVHVWTYLYIETGPWLSVAMQSQHFHWHLYFPQFIHFFQVHMILQNGYCDLVQSRN